MSRFVDTSEVAVTDGDDTIYVRRKMGIGIASIVQDAIFKLSVRDGKLGDVRPSKAAYDLAMLQHNIVRWEGPGFANGNGKAKPVTPEAIAEIDQHDPLLRKALDRIVELNAPPEDAPDPKSSTSNGASTSTASAKRRPTEATTSTPA